MARSLAPDPEGTELVVERLPIEMAVADVARRMADECALAVLSGRWAGRNTVLASDPAELVIDQGDPFGVVDRRPTVAGRNTGAVGGGWIGYLGYGVGRLVEMLPPGPPRVIPLPRFVLGYYDHLLRFDADRSEWWFEALVTSARRDAIAERRQHLFDLITGEAPPARSFALGAFAATPDRARHEAAVARTVEHIGAGDIYQANITMRLEAELRGSPLEFHLAGVAQLEPPYAAFLSGEWGAVSSLSPELFVGIRGATVTTSPIKGTAPRGRDPRSDEVARDALVASEKDRAENVMIVDLMRNDLGRVAVPGTVRVSELCSVRAMSGVWHMVSTVTAELRDEVSDGDVLRAAFPPGSVTGAPKVRAMEIIGDLEPTAREVYTGSVLLASPVAGLTSSVAIRTFEMSGGKVWIGVGGGIVADSTAPAEYDECLAKARPLLDAIGADLEADGTRPLIDRTAGVFETMLTIDGRVVDSLPHLDRLATSVRSLYGEVPLPSVAELAEAARTVSSGRGRLRVSVLPGAHPNVTASCEPFERTNPIGGLSLVPCTATGGLGPHKWRDRSWLDERAGALGGGVVLLVDGDQVLEGSRSNLFAVVGQTVGTPPADGRILPGLARRLVIDLLRRAGLDVREEPVTLEALAAASEVFVTNSLRGAEWVGACAGVGTWLAGPVAALARRLFDEDRVAHLECGVRPDEVALSNPVG